MARFKWNGPPPSSNSITSGPTYEVRLPKKDGTKQIITKPEGFVVGEDIGAEVTDERALRMIRADPKFSEII